MRESTMFTIVITVLVIMFYGAVYSKMTQAITEISAVLKHELNK